MKLLSGILLAAILASTPAGADPLQISANGRYLIDGEGRPFLLTGDSGWSIFAELTLADAKLYLQDRADRGFNFIAMNLIEAKFTTNAPANANGDAPFTGAPFATPNEAYFAHADSIFAFATSLDLVLFLSPVYLGYRCGDQGWCQEIESATLAEMRDWGRFVGARYGGHDNVIWSIGGDADPTPVADKLREFVLGIRDVDPDNLISAHNHRDTQAVTYWPSEPWLQVNNVFSVRTALYQSTTAAYEHTPVLPYIMLEGFYENEHGATDLDLRKQSYWTILTGGCGVVFGNCPLWHFGYSSSWCGLTNWEDQLDHAATVQMIHYRTLFESRRWWQLVPDFDHLVMTNGAGTDGTEEYATAAAAEDGSSIIAYAPTPRPMEFDTSNLTGTSVRAWWFDPADASSGLIGDFPSGTVSIASWSTGDRVIVLDDASLGFAAPGIPLLTPAPTPRSTLRLHQNQPNPFNPHTSIRFELSRASHIRITIFDARGRIVRNLVDRMETAGAHVASWDGRDDQGRQLGSGVYHCQLRTPEGSKTRQMVLLK